MDSTEAQERLQQLPGWKIDHDALVREFRFHDFLAAFDFMAAVAPEAEALNHHPEWSNSYNRVSVRLTTHDQAGLTEKDFMLAEIMNRLAGQPQDS